MRSAASREWIPLRTEDGSWTLLSPRHGEACHSRTGAWAEARARYAGACRLRERARAGVPLRILDVGTGLGWNLAAALEALADVPGSLCEAVSLERDAAVIEATLALHEERGASGEAWHGQVRAALRAALASQVPVRLGTPARGTLWLRLGDARERIRELPDEPRFDAVFLDPFSRTNEPELWTREFLTEVALRMAPEGLLSTYSSSFKVRLALAESGLGVGPGPPFGNKREGTLASPRAALEPLEERVRTRLEAESARRGVPPRGPAGIPGAGQRPF